MSKSPYENKNISEWSAITKDIISKHPLKKEVLLTSALSSWDRLWNTTVGDNISGFPLIELDPPATIIGYFFEKLLAKELANQFPSMWRGGLGSEKDLHCIQNDSFSIEMKASGQVGYKIFGNRSYGQKVENADSVKKDKSGFYITINFYKQSLTLIRFGWIDADDWQAQKSATGQMAGLKDEVYKYKLLPIKGTYMLNGPVQLIQGVGPKARTEFTSAGIQTIQELLDAKKLPSNLEKFRVAAKEFYL